MTKRQAQKVIKQLVSAINDKDNKYRCELWYIVSALRGPDTPDTLPDTFILKQATTEQIRGALGFNNNSQFIVSSFKRTYVPSTLVEADSHFHVHYIMAVDALRTLGFIPKQK